jgi:hypothetical protein
MIAVVLAGCEHDHFVVEVKPDGRGFQRTLTCWHVSGEGGKDIRPLAKDKLATIGKLYKTSETIEGGKKHVFTGRFTDKTPADVGGAGSYMQLTSPLGSTSSYIERFRGNDDLEASLAKRRAAADKLTDLAIGWFESELGQGPEVDRLKKFLDEDLRRDLKNLAIYGWTAEAVDGYKPETEGEFLLRVGHYLYERGYLSPEDVPGLARAVMADDPAPLLKHVQRLVAGKMGIAAGEPLPESLAFLSDPERLTASWSKYVQTTDLFKQRLKKWEEAKKTDPNADEPTPDDVLVELIDQLAFKIRIFEEDDVVELKLHCGQEPYATNGEWDDQADAVNWSKTMRSDAPLPVLCFALWSRPDRGFQEAHFGKVLLSDEKLAQYVVWHRGLGTEETKEWDEFIADCQPGADLKAAVEAFRFSSDPKPDPNKPDEKPASLADTPRRLILEALEPDEENEPRPPKKK